VVVDDQREIIEFLSSPMAYGHDATPVERIETHSSMVFLTGNRAYKLKRAVKYDYLDFSTSSKRRECCEAEVALNRRTAPGLYLGVVPVTRERDGRLALSGSGARLDWLVSMTRFDQDALLDRLAKKHTLDLEVMPLVAAEIARFHATAERRYDQGGHDNIAWVIDGNESGFNEQGSGILEPERCLAVTALARVFLEREAELLDLRRERGFVRVCHGDLHLRNIVLVAGRPTLFDGVEFNPQISCIDVLYDFAFLLMDLWRLRLRDHANSIFNEYLTRTNELGALSLLPLFLSCRSAVRAKTSATTAKLQSTTPQAPELVLTAREYLTMAEQLLKPPHPALIAIGGLSGTGKTTLARRLAAGIGPAPGAVVLRSDIIRKSFFNVSATTRLGAEGYTHSVTERVYKTAAERAATVLQSGHAAIVDATFGDVHERRLIADVAQRAGVPFIGLWLDAPVQVLMDRLGARHGDASDATVDVLHRQLAHDEVPPDWHRVNAAETQPEVQEFAESLLREKLEAVR
jgi:aminoglycoside phosphotransferase family enzyme/cytidylate kinase